MALKKEHSRREKHRKMMKTFSVTILMTVASTVLLSKMSKQMETPKAKTITVRTSMQRHTKPLNSSRTLKNQGRREGARPNLSPTSTQARYRVILGLHNQDHSKHCNP